MNLISFNYNDEIINQKYKKRINKNSSFIGEWCFSPKNIFSLDKKKKILSTYHWNTKSNIEDTIQYLKAINKKILNNLTISLNKYHKKNYNSDYWDMLLNRWLWEYINHLYSRWEISKIIKSKYKIKNFYSLNFKNDDFLPNNSFHFNRIVFSTNNYWGHWVFSNIFKFLNICKIQNIEINNKINIRNKILLLDHNPGYFNMKYFFLSSEKIFFYRFFIPLKEKLKILISKFTIAIKTSGEKKIKLSEKKNDRDNFYFFEETNDQFYNFVNYFLVKNFPKLYLENYNDLEEECSKVSWPKDPKKIVTTHGHYFDEVFKIYTAKKRLNGTKFLVLQHGSGGFYKDDNYFNVYHDVKLSDRYLTWGWKKTEKTYPLFINTVQGKKIKNFKFNFNKKILLILYELNSVSWYPPKGYLSEFNKKEIYIKMLSSFIKGLRKEIKDNIRAKILTMTGKGLIENSIRKEIPKVKFIHSKKNAYKIRDNFNIQIEAFLSTGFFEAMYLNHPVILLHDPRINNRYDKNFEKYIKILKENNICFEDVKKASKFLNNNYLHLDKWWNSDKIQNIRKLFCKENCKHSNNILEDLDKCLQFN